MPKEATKPYNYFDTPDDEDVDKKLLFVLKPTVLAALGVSTVDVLLNTKPKTYGQTLTRYFYFTAPFVAMSTAFVMTTTLACSIRKKDDKFNWFLGGAAAGSIFGVWRKNTMAGFMGCVVFGGLAMLKKHAVQHDWVLFPNGDRCMPGSLRSVRQDWTLTAERPRNWRTE